MKNYYLDIKNELLNNEINRRVKYYLINKNDLNTYYNVGKMLFEAGKCYGEGIIKEYSRRLTNDLGKGYTFTSLTRMRKFFLLLDKLATVSQQLSYGHYVELLPYEDINKVKYYIKKIEEQNLSIRQLRNKIKSCEYERLTEDTKIKLVNGEENNIIDYIKNPILVKNSCNYDIVSEKILQKLILEDMSFFLKELGNGFAFIDSEYKIKFGERYNYIDLLLFNYEYNCFVVVELKVTELKKEHIGQIEFYMNYVDENLKKINQNKTIGIIVCRQDDKYVIKYSSDKRIVARRYELI